MKYFLIMIFILITTHVNAEQDATRYRKHKDTSGAPIIKTVTQIEEADGTKWDKTVYTVTYQKFNEVTGTRCTDESDSIDLDNLKAQLAHHQSIVDDLTIMISDVERAPLDME